MLLFTGHPVRVRQIAVNAVRASGLVVSWQDIPMRSHDRLVIAFFQTRPIHIHFERLGPSLWRVEGPRHPYLILHSWAHAYPSWVSLLESVSGVTILNTDG